jgi:hypothetical protein
MMPVAAMTIKNTHESLVCGPALAEVRKHRKSVLIVFINRCESKMKSRLMHTGQKKGRTGTLTVWIISSL